MSFVWCIVSLKNTHLLFCVPRRRKWTNGNLFSLIISWKVQFFTFFKQKKFGKFLGVRFFFARSVVTERKVFVLTSFDCKWKKNTGGGSDIFSLCVIIYNYQIALIKLTYWHKLQRKHIVIALYVLFQGAKI